MVATSVLAVLITGLASFNSIAFKNAGRLVAITQAKELARGGIDRAAHKLSYDLNYTGETDVSISPVAGSIDISVTAPDQTTRQITVQSYVPNKQNPQITYKANASAATEEGAQGSVFSYALQVGQGGFYANQNPHINGSIYSNENISILGSGSSVSGNASAVGTVNIAGSVGSVNQGVTPAPLTEIDFTSWENEASAHGAAHNGDYAVASNSPITLGGDGNISVITGRLLISANPVITVAGPIWVQGIGGSSIEISGNPKFVIPENYGGSTTAIIANQRITISGNAEFKTDKLGAWLLLATKYPGTISPNTPAINIAANVKFYAASLYSSNGKLTFQNNTSGVKAVAFEAQRIQIDRNLTIDYDQGLAAINFEKPNAPSGGGFVITPGTYSEFIP